MSFGLSFYYQQEQNYEEHEEKKQQDVWFEVEVVQRLIFFPIELRTLGFNTMINCQLFQNFKQLGYSKFSYFTMYF